MLPLPEVKDKLKWAYLAGLIDGEVFYLEMKELNKRGKDDDDSERSG